MVERHVGEAACDLHQTTRRTLRLFELWLSPYQRRSAPWHQAFPSTKSALGKVPELGQGHGMIRDRNKRSLDDAGVGPSAPSASSTHTLKPKLVNGSRQSGCGRSACLRTIAAMAM